MNCYALFIDHFLHHLQQLRPLLLQSSCTRAAAFARIHRGVFVIRIPRSGFGGCNLSLSLRPRAFHVVIISKLSLHHCLTAVVAGLSQIPKEIATNSVECSPTLKRTQNGLLSHVIRWGVSSGLRAGARIPPNFSSQNSKDSAFALSFNVLGNISLHLDTSSCMTSRQSFLSRHAPVLEYDKTSLMALQDVSTNEWDTNADLDSIEKIFTSTPHDLHRDNVA